MGSRDSWLMASTLVAGCVFLGPEPVRASSTQLSSDSTNPRQTEQMEKCDAIKRDAGEPTTTGRWCSTISRSRCPDWATPHTNIAPRQRWRASGKRLGAPDPTPTSRNEIRRFPSKRLEKTLAR